MRKVLFAVLLAIPVSAQTRDFLSPEEIDQLRETQEPNLRLQLYSKFALRRVDEIEQQMKENKTGRSGFVHDLLEDYMHVIEAVDTVTDDALRRKVAVDIGTAAVANAEKDYLVRLQKIRDSKPRDLTRFEFALREAIEATQDSIEAAQQDLVQRSKEVLTKIQKEKEDKAKGMAPEGGEAAGGSAAKKKEVDEAKPAAPKRKAPTLRRPGEPDPAATPPAPAPKRR